MGSSQSSQPFSPEQLSRYVSTEPIPPHDEFWKLFLQVDFSPLVGSNVETFFEKLNPACNTLLANNLKSGNVNSLINVFLLSIDKLVADCDNKTLIELCTEAHNSLFIVRCYIQYLEHKFSEKEIIKHLECRGSLAPQKTEGQSDDSLYAELIQKLISSVNLIPLNDLTCLLHYEIINALLVLLSLQLFTTENCYELVTYKLVFDDKHASQMCKTLLSRFIDQGKSLQSGKGSFILDLAADLIQYFLPLPVQDPSLLARNSILLCNVLVNNTVQPNVYRECIASISDNFDGLYQTICSELDQEETTLILYHLLHRNSLFRNYVLARKDIQNMVLPMLKTIYLAKDTSCRHMYMSLIILLILTEDTEFNKKIHRVRVTAKWYYRSLPEEISLGGLIILVTARTVQFNLLKTRDEYLHINCLAALANMSSQFKNLHPYVCQRLVSLFGVLAKTYERANQELVIIERALRIILEVFNSCLANQMVHNVDLVYNLLYERQIFVPLRNNPAFEDIVKNLEEVLDYFNSKIDGENGPCDDVNDVLAIICNASARWPSHKLQKFPELKFKYVEEEKPENFFIPYVWSLVTTRANLYWNKSPFPAPNV
ncbi:Dyggve-Melchior-Clausen syndrome protein [Nesidiocoris tenuis]|uniref:Dymeclin n=1 Tax=Nesidiocoris tenuis TaxID=355587 RepID=A0ABN7AJI2_9HEMI|nr:Dyggve-Melchior-Clausen syndrome protein [Nesidiocoris tenuis]